MSISYGVYAVRCRFRCASFVSASSMDLFDALLGADFLITRLAALCTCLAVLMSSVKIVWRISSFVFAISSTLFRFKVSIFISSSLLFRRIYVTSFAAWRSCTLPSALARGILAS